MKFVFWQNILSMHQVSFIEALAQRYPVVLVAEKESLSDRTKMGWKVPVYKYANVIVSPDNNAIRIIINKNENAIHFFSGIDAFPMVYSAFKICASRHLKIGFYQEPYNWLGLKGKLRSLKYRYLALKFNKYIDFILPTGNGGMNCFRNARFNEDKLYQWAYFTNSEPLNKNKLSKNGIVNVLFVGSIENRKNILGLIDVILKISGNISFQFTIIGDGPQKEILTAKIQGCSNIKYLGALENKRVKEQMYGADILVLPSFFDGWGAVVNEALMVGTRVIASDRCGSSILLDGKSNGEQFSYESETNNLESVLYRWIEKGSLSSDERILLSEKWMNYLSGQLGADYFLKICNYIFNNNGEDRPIAPWVKSNTCDILSINNKRSVV